MSYVYPETNSGFVYLLTNESMPGYVKIGQTESNPFVRASDLFTTGVPTRFIVARAWFVVDRVKVEKLLHDAFDPYRVEAGNREFFKVDSIVAEDVIFSLISKFLVGEVHGNAADIDKLTSEVMHYYTQSEHQSKELERLKLKLATFEECKHELSSYIYVKEQRDLYRERLGSLEVLNQKLESYIFNLGERHRFWLNELLGKH
jgi:hypothetical protein